MARLTILATGERLIGSGVRAFDPVIRELLESARQEIQMAVYRFDVSSLPLLEILVQAASRGVRVLVIVSSFRSQPPEVQKVLQRLENLPGTVLVDFSATGSLLHAKTIVVDRKRAVIGSANLTWGGMVTNHEIGVLIEGREAWEIGRLLDHLR